MRILDLPIDARRAYLSGVLSGVGNIEWDGQRVFVKLGGVEAGLLRALLGVIMASMRTVWGSWSLAMMP